eukprot:1422150-Prymnesium_polylepis.1
MRPAASAGRQRTACPHAARQRAGRARAARPSAAGGSVTRERGRSACCRAVHPSARRLATLRPPPRRPPPKPRPPRRRRAPRLPRRSWTLRP